MRTGMKRGLVLGMTACLAMTSLAGCSKEKELDMTKAAAVLDGEEVSAGVMNFMLRYEQAQFESSFGAWLKSYYPDLWNSDLTGTGEVYGDTFKEQMTDTVEKLLLAEKHMGDYGVELTDEEKAAITQAASDFIAANEEEVLEKMSATQENVERVLTLRTIQTKMEPEMCADVDTEVSDEEAAQRTVSYVRFSPETEAESEEETEAASESGTEEASAEAETAAESETAAETEAETKEAAGQTEAQTEEAEEADAQAAEQTEGSTEAQTEEAKETEAQTEEQTEAQTESQTEEKTSEASVTEAESAKTGSADTEVETETEAAQTEAAGTEAAEAESTEAAGETENETETETETEDPAMIAAKAEAKAQAEEFLAQAKETDDFAAAAAEIAEESDSITSSSFTFGEDDTYPDAAIIEATRDLEDGALVGEVIEAGDNYYVLHVDDAFDEEATADKKDEIVEERKRDAINALYEEWIEGAEFTVVDEVYSQLTFNLSLTIETEAAPETEAVETETEAGSEAAETEAAETEAAETETEAAETEAGTEAAETEAATEAAETEAAETEAAVTEAEAAVTEAVKAGAEAETEAAQTETETEA